MEYRKKLFKIQPLTISERQFTRQQIEEQEKKGGYKTLP